MNLASLLVEIAELSDEMILVTDTGSIDEPGPAIVYANPAFTRMTGYRPDELTGRTPRVLQGPKTSLAACARIRSALQQWQPIHIELLNYRKDGSEFEVELTILPVADENGWFRYWVSVQREIKPAGSGESPTAPQTPAGATDTGEPGAATADGALSLYFSLLWLIQRGDRAVRSGQTLALETDSMAAIDRLVSSAASGAFDGAAADDPRAASCPSHGARVIDTISARIAELLDSPRAHATDIQPIDVAALAQACVANHQGTFGRRRQQLSFESSLAHALCAADARLLAEVLTRLLANASESMPAGHHCQISVTETPARTVRIEVRDTGSGIAPELMRNVFSPFFTTKAQGLGLGLPLARVIVERFGGRMHLHSERGAGTTVRIDLPRN